MCSGWRRRGGRERGRGRGRLEVGCEALLYFHRDGSSSNFVGDGVLSLLVASSSRMVSHGSITCILLLRGVRGFSFLSTQGLIL